MITLPFSKRTTAAVSVFACLAVAAPASTQGPTQVIGFTIGSQQSAIQSAQGLTTDPAILAALSLEYAQLLSVYGLFLPGPQFFPGPQALSVPLNTYVESLLTDPAAAFAANVASAITAVGKLQTTLGLITVIGDQSFLLARMKEVVNSALVNLENVQTDLP